MNENRPDLAAFRLLRLAAILWIAYFLTLAALDTLLMAHKPFAPLYYGINIVMALLVLGLALWRWAQRKAGHILLPAIIVLMATLPIVVNYLTAQMLPGLFAPAPNTTPAEMLVRLLPILFIALALTAWQYHWPYVILFSVGTTLLNLLMLIFTLEIGSVPFFHGFVITTIQMVSFLVVGYFVTTLTDRLRAQHASLESANAELARYAGALESLTISRERNRMAQELHDTLAHTLSGLAVQLETVKAYWAVDEAVAQGQLDQALAAARSGLQETRRALKALRASPLDDLGLPLALRQLAESAAQRGGLTLNLDLPERAPALAPDVEQCIYRVAQEAVANTLAHARARRLDLRLVAGADATSLTIQDDGVGFAPAGAEAAGHFGLLGMRERAAMAGGALEIESQAGAGVTVRLTITRAQP